MDLTWDRLPTENQVADRRIRDCDIGAYGPDRMAQVADGLWQIAFNDMPRDESQIRESEQRSASLWSAQYGGNESDGGQIVSDDRTPAVEWVEVLCPVLSCELSVRRNHV
jgi:hypothetical protein